MTDVRGIDSERVTAWFAANVDGMKAPLQFELIAGGRSNLTFLVTDAVGRRAVLRRPPVSHLLPTAHDMAREHRIITALADTDVPVAPVLGFCDDPDVTGQPFYVMDFVDGLILRDAEAGVQLPEDRRGAAADSMIEVMARIHAVDPDAVGLGDLGRKEGYIARQLNRWHRQFEQSKTREVPLVDEVHDFLAARIPEQGPAAIVHGDYRLDNTIIGSDGQIRAVLDWELCTLGDPLADVGLTMVYWYDADEPPPDYQAAPASTLPGFPTKAYLAARYAELTGTDLGLLDYYVSFGFWKLACIADGVFARYSSGAMNADDGYAGNIDRVPRLAELAKAAADRYAAS
jgi:aminoglycoside phosphotransferase (APT) family kinase protein